MRVYAMLHPILIALLFTSCVSPRMAAVLTFPRPQVDGPYAGTLTVDEMVEIAALPYGHEDIRKPVYSIYMEHPHQADVTSGRLMDTEDKVTFFKVRKVNGKWIIITSSVHDNKAGPITS
jgi:hypothetical protein